MNPSPSPAATLPLHSTWKSGFRCCSRSWGPGRPVSSTAAAAQGITSWRSPAGLASTPSASSIPAEKVRRAQQHGTLRDRVQEGNLEAIPFPDDAFDLALLNEVLEHVPDEPKVLAEIRRVSRPGGRLVVFSPNRWFPFETHGVVSKSSGRMLPPSVPLIPIPPVVCGAPVLSLLGAELLAPGTAAAPRAGWLSNRIDGVRVANLREHLRFPTGLDGGPPGRSCGGSRSRWSERRSSRGFGVSQVVVVQKKSG